MKEKVQRRDYDGKYQKRPTFARRNLNRGNISEKEIENFTSPKRTSLLQCWNKLCRLVQLREFTVCRPHELRCRACQSQLEVLDIDGVPILSNHNTGYGI